MIELNFVEKGCGEPLIMLHGNGEDSSYFKYQINYLSQYYHVIAVDSRGHGKTARGEKDLTLAQMRDDLKLFMEKHSLKKANILGFSDGANIAMLFAIKYPENVNKLILNGGNIYFKGIKSTFRFIINLAVNILNLFVVHRNFKIKHKEILRLIIDEPNLRPKDLKKIKAKTLVIAGTKDLIYKEHTELIADNIPDSRLLFINGDHFIAQKKYPEFNKLVVSFLSE